MKVEIKELKISNELVKKVDMRCKFAGVSSNLTSGCVKNVKGQILPISINGNDYLLFEECDDIFLFYLCNLNYSYKNPFVLLKKVVVFFCFL